MSDHIARIQGYRESMAQIQELSLESNLEAKTAGHYRRVHGQGSDRVDAPVTWQKRGVEPHSDGSRARGDVEGCRMLARPPRSTVFLLL